MRQSLTALCLFLAFSLSAQVSYGSWGGNKRVKGNGDVITENRDLSGFTGVSTCCAIKVELKKGNFDVKVEAESNLQDYVLTRVSGDRLIVRFKEKISIKSRESVKVYVSMPELDYAAASSSGTINCQSTFTGDELDVSVSSGSRVSVAFEGEEVDADASSGGRVEITGSATRVRADASSGGSVRGTDFTATSARCEASSGGSVRMGVKNKLRADASSGGTVRYYGNPSNVSVDSSSGGSVRRGN